MIIFVGESKDDYGDNYYKELVDMYLQTHKRHTTGGGQTQITCQLNVDKGRFGLETGNWKGQWERDLGFGKEDS